MLDFIYCFWRRENLGNELDVGVFEGRGDVVCVEALMVGQIDDEADLSVEGGFCTEEFRNGETVFWRFWEGPI